jgi:hypothetical protein
LVIEARDALLAVIAPALKLRMFINRGPMIARALRVQRRNRPMQLTMAAKILLS